MYCKNCIKEDDFDIVFLYSEKDRVDFKVTKKGTDLEFNVSLPTSHRVMDMLLMFDRAMETLNRKHERVLK